MRHCEHVSRSESKYQDAAVRSLTSASFHITQMHVDAAAAATTAAAMLQYAPVSVTDRVSVYFGAQNDFLESA